MRPAQNTAVFNCASRNPSKLKPVLYVELRGHPHARWAQVTLDERFRQYAADMYEYRLDYLLSTVSWPLHNVRLNQELEAKSIELVLDENQELYVQITLNEGIARSETFQGIKTLREKAATCPLNLAVRASNEEAFMNMLQDDGELALRASLGSPLKRAMQNLTVKIRQIAKHVAQKGLTL